MKFQRRIHTVNGGYGLTVKLPGTLEMTPHKAVITRSISNPYTVLDSKQSEHYKDLRFRTS